LKKEARKGFVGLLADSGWLVGWLVVWRQNATRGFDQVIGVGRGFKPVINGLPDASCSFVFGSHCLDDYGKAQSYPDGVLAPQHNNNKPKKR